MKEDQTNPEKPPGNDASGNDALYKHILLATNGSQAAKKAQDVTLYLGRMGGSRLTVVHVLDDSLCHYGRFDTLVPVGTGDDFCQHVMADRISEGQTVVSDFTRAAEQSGVEFKLEIRQGDPVSKICELAEAIDADLVIVGRDKNKKRSRFKSAGISDRLRARLTCTLMAIS